MGKKREFKIRKDGKAQSVWRTERRLVLTRDQGSCRETAGNNAGRAPQVWRVREQRIDPGGPEVITRVIIQEGGKRLRVRERRWKQRSEERRCCSAGFEDGGWGHKPRNVGSL